MHTNFPRELKVGVGAQVCVVMVYGCLQISLSETELAESAFTDEHLMGTCGESSRMKSSCRMMMSVFCPWRTMGRIAMARRLDYIYAVRVAACLVLTALLLVAFI